MIEVSSTSAMPSRVVVPASSKGAGSVAAVSDKGKTLPPVIEPTKDVAKSAVEPGIELDRAVARMNEYIQAEQRDLQFSIDESSGQTVVRVTDRETGDLIRQIPNEVFLTLAEQARKNEAIQLISANG